MKFTTIEELRRCGLLPASDPKPQGRKVGTSERTKLEDAFLAAWRSLFGGMLPEPVTQHRFHPTRRWRFDFAFPDQKLAVEIQGGSWVNGRHTRGSHQEDEHEKMNAAVAAGWAVLQFGTSRMKDPMAVAAEVADVLRQRLTRKEPSRA